MTMRGSSLPILPDPSRVVVPASPLPVETGGLLSCSLKWSPVLSEVHGQGSPEDHSTQAWRDTETPRVYPSPKNRTSNSSAPRGSATKRNSLPPSSAKPSRSSLDSRSNGRITSVTFLPVRSVLQVPHAHPPRTTPR